MTPCRYVPFNVLYVVRVFCGGALLFVALFAFASVVFTLFRMLGGLTGIVKECVLSSLTHTLFWSTALFLGPVIIYLIGAWLAPKEMKNREPKIEWLDREGN